MCHLQPYHTNHDPIKVEITYKENNKMGKFLASLGE